MMVHELHSFQSLLPADLVVYKINKEGKQNAAKTNLSQVITTKRTSNDGIKT
jgi:hypothetical protein